MIILNDILIDEDLFLQKFVCDLKTCKGECCVEGDSGAPLLEKELYKLEEFYPQAKEYLSEENQLNFRSAPTVPVRYKMGELADGTSAYRVFETREELAEFNEAVANHIAQCLNAGWDEKDAVDYSVYEIV